MALLPLADELQDVVLWIEARWTFDIAGHDLEELGDAMLADLQDVELDAIETRVLERVWNPEVEADLADALAAVAEQSGRCRHVVERARLDLDTRHHLSGIARAIVRQIAYQAAHDRLPFMFCLCCLEERIHNRPGERRAAALEAAAIAWPDADIETEELEAVAKRCALNPAALPALLATDARRNAVRERLRRLAGFAAGRQPELSRELRKILAEPLPPDPRDDALWVELCRGLARFELLPGFN